MFVMVFWCSDSRRRWCGAFLQIAYFMEYYFHMFKKADADKSKAIDASELKSALKQVWPYAHGQGCACCTVCPDDDARGFDGITVCHSAFHSVGSPPNCLDKSLHVHGRGACGTPVPRQIRPSGLSCMIPA